MITSLETGLLNATAHPPESGAADLPLVCTSTAPVADELSAKRVWPDAELGGASGLGESGE